MCTKVFIGVNHIDILPNDNYRGQKRLIPEGLHNHFILLIVVIGCNLLQSTPATTETNCLRLSLCSSSGPKPHATRTVSSQLQPASSTRPWIPHVLAFYLLSSFSLPSLSPHSLPSLITSIIDTLRSSLPQPPADTTCPISTSSSPIHFTPLSK